MSETPTIYANTSQLIATEEPDFPAFLYSAKEMHRAVKVFKKGFDGLLTYAVKCNPSPHVIKQLHEEGLKAFDQRAKGDGHEPCDHAGCETEHCQHDRATLAREAKPQMLDVFGESFSTSHWVPLPSARV